ncbi:MAG: clostripain-related cysteine peptidase [Candidatus Aminicenantes bacterium]|nr:clostripain-related cysteine peptidase [Candidatus Aminicenantes bacterium]
MPKAATKKPWTFMVYMAGDNNLDPDGVKDLKEMKKVGSTGKVNVIAQFDRATGHVAKRYLLRKGGKVTDDAVASLGKINAGDPKRLMDFINWGVGNYPADNYVLVLWNHGQGWDDTDVYADERHRRLRRLASGRIRHALFHTPVRRTLTNASRDAQVRAILLDDDAKDFLDNAEMKNVLAEAKRLIKRKLDIVGMDACLMSMAEVGYQIRESADYTVGSEETAPLDGWPYDTILASLAKTPSMTPCDLSTLIVNKYLDSYKPADGVTYSACDLSKADTLAAAVAALARTLQARLSNSAERQRILSVRSQVQSYDVADNIDLVDFCSLLAASGAGSAVVNACRKVIKAAESSYVVAQGFKGAGMKNSHGVAVYFPTQRVSPLYAGLDFSKKTGWDAFLKAYLAAIRSR